MLGSVKVWNIGERWLESKFAIHTGAVTQILIFHNNTTMLTSGIDAKIFIISLSNRETVAYFTHKSPIFSLAISSDESYLATGEKQMINFKENPLASQTLSIVGPEDRFQEFLSYMRDVLLDQHPLYDNTFDSFLVLPHQVNSLHIFSYLNLKEYISKALSHNAAVIKTKTGFHPLYIALLKDFKGIRDEIIKSFCVTGKRNPFLLTICEDQLVEMNKIGFGTLTDLYEVLYQESQRKSLPKFCESTVVLPIVNISINPRIKIADFLEEKDISTQGVSVIFKESYARINFNMGSRESLNFLTSLQKCRNTEVFKTPFILDVIRHKWEYARFPLMYQGFMYYSYLITLSVYTAYFVKNPYFQYTLFTMNALLNIFEVYLMIVSGRYYFTYV